jgi:hypothetical protein
VSDASSPVPIGIDAARVRGPRAADWAFVALYRAVLTLQVHGIISASRAREILGFQKADDWRAIIRNLTPYVDAGHGSCSHCHGTGLEPSKE